MRHPVIKTTRTRHPEREAGCRGADRDAADQQVVELQIAVGGVEVLNVPAGDVAAADLDGLCGRFKRRVAVCSYLSLTP